MTRSTILLQALTSTTPDIRRLVSGFQGGPSNDTAKVYWLSALALIDQLGTHEVQFQVRMARVIAEDRPHLALFSSEPVMSVSGTSILQAAEHFAVAREETLADLQALRPGQWQRVGMLAGSGRRSLRFLAQDLVDHDIACTNELVQLLVDYRKVESAVVQETIAG